MVSESFFSKRGDIPPFIVMDVLQQANAREREMGDVLHLEVGQPATPAPDLVLEAAAKALKDQSLGYTDAMGILPLRERIARHYHEKYNIEVSPERILITTGSSAGFVLSFLSCFNEGDRVALPEPGYPCYRHILKTLSIQPVAIPTDADSRWMPTTALLEEAERQMGYFSEAQNSTGTNGLNGLVLASPANPTGTALSGDMLQQLIAFCANRNARFISDEIYHGLNYVSSDVSALEFSDEVIVINSFSKYYSMTGWRIGWMILPQKLVRVVERLMQNLFISAPTLSQYAALAAFDAAPQLEEWKAGYARNRKFLLKQLPELGLPVVVPPDGAFYLYMNIHHLRQDSIVLCKNILDATGVALTPGKDFDDQRGDHFVRLSYARSHGEIREAIERLSHWFHKNVSS